ncbi:hypothetical protein F5B21DRAFT_455083 [Xylaria acuta]|nr:hypothetical protein F5B21DRAFT_455083 [Xylaria acuta]
MTMMAGFFVFYVSTIICSISRVSCLDGGRKGLRTTGRAKEPMYKNGPRRRALNSSTASRISLRTASWDASSFMTGGGRAKVSEKSPPGWPFVPSCRTSVFFSMRAASSEIDLWDAMVGDSDLVLSS